MNACKQKNINRVLRVKISNRNKRCVRIPQTFLNFDNSVLPVAKNINKTGILYKYYEGYLLFELDEHNKPYKIWRDRPSGNYPLVTTYVPLRTFTDRIIKSNIKVMYTNDAKPLSPFFDMGIDNPIAVRPFFVPIDELLETIITDLHTELPNAGIPKSPDANVTVSTPSYDDIKKLDPTISYKDFLHIYK